MYEDVPYQCGACGYCLDSCSVYRTTLAESLSPRGKLVLLRKHAEGALTNVSSLAERLYTCTLCGKCEDACPSKTRVAAALQEWRYRHPLGDSPVRSCVGSIFTEGNPYHRPHAERVKWYSGEDVDSSTAYFPGCTTSFMQPQVAASFVSVVQDMVSLQVVDDRCCGSLLSRAGFREEALTVVEKNVEYFKEKGIKTLITSCAGCYSFFLTYPFTIKVEHTSQVLSRHVDEFTPVDVRTTYHDPCHLLRNAVTSQPRNILKTLTIYSEKETQACCGAGGGMLLNFREVADSVCRALLKDTMSSTLVTACPFCLYHMKRNTLHPILSIEEVVYSCRNLK